jgi:transcriptional regulator with XRE-family HTH domain
MSNNSTPSPRPGDRSRLAQALRDARQRVGLSGVEAGRRAGLSQSKVSKIERQELLPSIDDVQVLCRVYEIHGEERDDLMALVAGLRQQQSSRVTLARRVPEIQRRIGQLEASASLIRSFQPAMVIGLLQTVAYMRCVFGTPDSQALSGEEIDGAVAEREARQRVLSDPEKQFVLIMSEGALRWQACSPAVMAEQADAIAEVSLPNVRIGIIPWTVPVDVFPTHGFHLYDDDAVVMGTATSALATMTAAADIATYAELFSMLEALAVFGGEAREHLARIADEYRSFGAR